jgi:hypothetical protein
MTTENPSAYRVLTKHMPIRVAGLAIWQASPSAQVQDAKLLSFSLAFACCA